MKSNKTTIRRALALCTLLVISVPSLVLARGLEIRLETKLAAPSAAGDLSGQASFRHRLGRARRQLSVEIEGFKPGDMYDVMVAGKVVGTLLIDAFGIGRLDLDDRSDQDDNDLPFPSDFPELNGGESVQVGPLNGTLQPK